MDEHLDALQRAYPHAGWRRIEPGTERALYGAGDTGRVYAPFLRSGRWKAILGCATGYGDGPVEAVRAAAETLRDDAMLWAGMLWQEAEP